MEIAENLPCVFLVVDVFRKDLKGESSQEGQTPGCPMVFKDRANKPGKGHLYKLGRVIRSFDILQSIAIIALQRLIR
jgi:hypothetical protein